MTKSEPDLKYRITCTKISTEESADVTVYGIEGLKNGKTAAAFYDISPNKALVQALIDRLYRGNADPMLLRDFVEDYIDEIYSITI